MNISTFYTILLLFSLTTIGFTTSCNTEAISNVDVKYASLGVSELDFASYWFKGKAELNRYKLYQSRYGETHEGDAVLIFVTENFRTDKQIKFEGQYPNAPKTSVLKLNALRKFPTGLYDYSIMTSVFTPIEEKEYPHTLKVSTSVQDWCGHAYIQLNAGTDKYKVNSHSYFESEADRYFETKTTVLEDELFTRIRLNPDLLPIGKYKIIPSTIYTRLLHKKITPLKAEAYMETCENKGEYEGENLLVYNLQYTNIDRSVRIVFEKAFPHQIAGWEETFSIKGKNFTTKAIRSHTIMNDYWNKNDVKDLPLRKELGL